MVRTYLAGPNHTPQDRAALEILADAVRGLGHEPFIPHRELAKQTPNDDRATFRFLLAGLDASDAVIALLDGSDADPQTCFELGVAHAARRPVLGLRSDRRDTSNAVNLLARTSARELQRVDAWTVDALRPLLDPFLANVRVLAGTLVRDAVPKILEDEGRALKFRNVTPTEYPGVLKRKISETARHLEETEWGVEQEEIADLLELLETLINIRKYDKESLRSIKEGRWRKRGGYERGYLLDEEPKLATNGQSSNSSG